MKVHVCVSTCPARMFFSFYFFFSCLLSQRCTSCVVKTCPHMHTHTHTNKFSLTHTTHTYTYTTHTHTRYRGSTPGLRQTFTAKCWYTTETKEKEKKKKNIRAGHGFRRYAFCGSDPFPGRNSHSQQIKKLWKRWMHSKAYVCMFSLVN